MKIKKIVPLLILTLLIIVFLPIVSIHAAGIQDAFNNAKGALDGNVKTVDFATFAGTMAKGLLGLIGAIFVLLIIISGFTWMTSQGDTAKIKKAKDIIIWSVAGIAIILVSYTLVTFIFSTFGVSSSATTGASTGVTDPNLTPSTPGQDSATVNSSQTDDPPENPGQSTR